MRGLGVMRAFDGHEVTREEMAADVTDYLEARGLTANLRDRERILRVIETGHGVWHAVAVTLKVCCHCARCRR